MSEVTQELLLELLEYGEETGDLWWRVREPHHFTDGVRWSAEVKCKIWNSKYAHKEAGSCLGKRGYRVIAIHGKILTTHRVIWLLKTGGWPENIDHIDGDRANNSWGNLREVTNLENRKNSKMQINNTSGVVGVCWNNEKNSWQVRIGKKLLGRFKDFDEAVRVRKSAEKCHGYHENHGREV